MPPGVELKLIRDAGSRVEASVESVQSALIEGAVLTVFTVFLFLNSWRSTVITGLALPVSVLASFIAVLMFGFKLETMSLLGLSLAIGILIDDAIVVRENIVRHVEMGKDHYTAAREGTAEIGLAVAATTFSIVVVFVPIGYMGGLAQQWFAPFALTIACSVLVSLFVSFSLDPMLSAYWPDPHIPIEQRSFISRGLDHFNRWFDRQADRYKSVIGWALRHRFAMVLLTIGSFVGAIALPAMGFIGGGFMPIMDNSEFSVVVTTPPGSNIAYTKLKTQEVSTIARALPEVAYTYTSIGGQTESVDEGTVYVRLKPRVRAHAPAGGRGGGPARQAVEPRWRRGLDQHQLLRQHQADPAAADRTQQVRRPVGAGREDPRRGAQGARGGGRRPVDQGPQARDRRGHGPWPRRVARRDRRPGRAGAAPGVRRDRHRRLDRPAGRDAATSTCASRQKRARAPGTCRSCRSRCRGRRGRC